MSEEPRSAGRGWLARVPVLRRRTRLDVRVERAADGRRYRLTARNASPRRTVYVTHAWFRGEDTRYDVLGRLPYPPEGWPRPRPNARLAPGEAWAAEVEAADLDGIGDVEHAGRVRTSLGKVVASRPAARAEEGVTTDDCDARWSAPVRVNLGEHGVAQGADQRRLHELARVLEPAARECAARPEWGTWTPAERLWQFFSDPGTGSAAETGLATGEISRLAGMAGLAEALRDHRTPEAALPVLMELWADRVPEPLAAVFGYQARLRP